MTKPPSRRPKPAPKPKFRPTFIRQWREYRELTLEAAAERVGDYLRDRGLAEGYTHNSLGRLERGDFAYKQPILEAVAHVLKTDVASLLRRDPTSDEAFWDVWNSAGETERERIEEYANFITGKAETSSR